MNLNRKEARESVKILADYVRRNNLDAFVSKASYLTGIYGVFYAIAVFESLDEDNRQKLCKRLQEQFDRPLA